MTIKDTLEQEVDRILIDGMRPQLKAAIDAALAAGAHVQDVRRHIHRLTGGPNAQPGGLTYLACEAYLQKQAREGGGA
jgi:hypothetical protein